MKKLLICLLVIACLTGLCFAAEGKPADQAKATWTDGTETFEGTVAECMAKVNEKGGTLTLQEDLNGAGAFPTTRNDIDDNDFIIGATKAFVLDLNGKTFTAPEGVGAIYVNPGEEGEGGVFVVKNGRIDAYNAENVYAANCGMQILDVTMTNVKAQNVSYYDFTGKWNKDNLIQGSTIMNTVWYCISFNSTWETQEKASITIIDSVLAPLRGSGYAPVGLQTKPAGSTGNVVYGENVTVYTYAASPVHKSLKSFGEAFVEEEGVDSATVLGEVYDMVNVFKTPAQPTMDIATVIPGEGEATMENSPAKRKVTIVPLEEQQKAAAKEEAKTENKEETKAPAAKAEGGNMGLIIGIVAAVVVVIAVVVVVSKKKKQ